ncbi:MAG: hypothetical protein HY718_18295 [Planctomycetes bacterium]|nr:hypothetical protein [Planctomycetota bacterium]
MNILRIALMSWLAAVPAWAADDAATSRPADTVEFCFAPTPGQVQRSRVATTTFGSMRLFGSLPPQKFSQRFEQEVVMKCLRVNPDKTSVFAMTMPAIAMQMNLAGIKMEVDTRRPSPATRPEFDIVNRLFSSMTKLECTLTFSPEGEPLKVEGLSKGMEAVLEELGELAHRPGMKHLIKQMREFLGDNIIEDHLRSTFRMFPDDGKARVGDTWTREWQMTLPMLNIASQGRGEYELLGVEEFRGRPCAKIRVKSSMSTLPKAAPGPAKAGDAEPTIFDRMQFSMNASGGNGTAYIDYTTGDLVQYREVQRITMEMSIAPDPQASEDEGREGLAKVSQILNTSVEIDLLDEKPTSAE